MNKFPSSNSNSGKGEAREVRHRSKSGKSSSDDGGIPQDDRKCHGCGKRGHIKPHCPNRKKSDYKWRNPEFAEQASDMNSQLAAANDTIRQLQEELSDKSADREAREEREEEKRRDEQVRDAQIKRLIEDNFGEKEFQYFLPRGDTELPEVEPTTFFGKLGKVLYEQYFWNVLMSLSSFIFVSAIYGKNGFPEVPVMLMLSHLFWFTQEIVSRVCRDVPLGTPFSERVGYSGARICDVEYDIEYHFGSWFYWALAFNYFLLIFLWLKLVFRIGQVAHEWEWNDEICYSYEAHVFNQDEDEFAYPIRRSDLDFRADAAALSSIKHKDPLLCKVTKRTSIMGKYKDQSGDDMAYKEYELDTQCFTVSLEYVLQMLGARGLDYGRTYEEARSNFQQISGRIQNVNLDRVRGASLAIIPNSVVFATAIFCHHKQNMGTTELPPSHPV